MTMSHLYSVQSQNPYQKILQKNLCEKHWTILTEKYPMQFRKISQSLNIFCSNHKFIAKILNHEENVFTETFLHQETLWKK